MHTGSKPADLLGAYPNGAPYLRKEGMVCLSVVQGASGTKLMTTRV